MVDATARGGRGLERRRPDGSEDFTRPNVGAFRHFERRVRDLMDLGILIEEHDPNRHLTSIHNGEPEVIFDHRKRWVSHVCVQHEADLVRQRGAARGAVGPELEQIAIGWSHLIA